MPCPYPLGPIWIRNHLKKEKWKYFRCDFGQRRKATTAVTAGAAIAYDTFTLESDPLCYNYGFSSSFTFLFCVPSAAPANPSHIANIRTSYTLTKALGTDIGTHTHILNDFASNAVNRLESLTLQICCFWYVRCANYFNYTRHTQTHADTRSQSQSTVRGTRNGIFIFDALVCFINSSKNRGERERARARNAEWNNISVYYNWRSCIAIVRIQQMCSMVPWWWWCVDRLQ